MSGDNRAVQGDSGLSLSSLIRELASSRVYDLEQPRFFGMPNAPSHLPGFVYTLHRHHESGGEESRTSASGLVISPEHAGTHIDALCHQAEELQMYGGIQADPSVQSGFGFTKLGAETIAPILARGVLLDIASHSGVARLPERHLITATEFEMTAAAQGTSVQKGDVVLVRTGYGAHWDDPKLYEHAAGVHASGSRWLADRQVRVVGADNVAWDIFGLRDEEMGVSLPGHVILLVRNGIHILEHLYLEQLAQDRVHEFAFVCLPLKMRGATGSPIRPIAVVSERGTQAQPG